GADPGPPWIVVDVTAGELGDRRARSRQMAGGALAQIGVRTPARAGYRLSLSLEHQAESPKRRVKGPEQVSADILKLGRAAIGDQREWIASTNLERAGWPGIASGKKRWAGQYHV